ncbi:MAG: hypothetical protein ACLQU2_00320 [Candidatus Binataceae bacterium]
MGYIRARFRAAMVLLRDAILMLKGLGVSAAQDLDFVTVLPEPRSRQGY